MKVGVFTEYGLDIGYGHVSRTSSIAEVLASFGCDVNFYIRESDKFEHNLGFQVHLCEWSDKDIFTNISNNTDIFLVDSYRVPKELLNSLFCETSRLFSIIDSKLNYPDFGTLIFPSVYAENYVFSNNLKVLSGINYLLFRSLLRAKKRGFILENSIQNISVSLGGFVSTELLNSVIENLILYFKKDVKIHILGTNKLDSILSSRLSVYGFIDTNKYLDVLQSSDLVISNGGQSLNEALALNIPTIAIETACNQKENILSWTSLNCCYGMLQENSSSFVERLNKGLKLMEVEEKRREFSQNTFKLIDLSGALRVSQYMLYGTKSY